MADESKQEGQLPTPPARPPVAPRPPATAGPDLAGRTTTVASQGGAAAKGATTSAATPAGAAARDADDTSPLLTRRAWIGLAWGAFSAATRGLSTRGA